jgi:hypothetical protein
MRQDLLNAVVKKMVAGSSDTEPSDAEPSDTETSDFEASDTD